MEELNENNAFLNPMRELVNNLELQARREAWSSNNSARDMQFQHGFYPPVQQNSYPQEHYYYSAQDQVHYQNSDFVQGFQNSAYGDASLDFQQQEASFYPQPYAPVQCSDFQQEEHGYYPQNQSLESQQWSCYDSTPSPISAAQFAALMEALKPSTAACSSKDEDNGEEERNALAMVDNEQELSQEAEKLEIGTSAGKFRIGEELNEEETELIFSLLSAHYQDEIQQQKEEEKVEKELNAGHDSSLSLKSKEATASLVEKDVEDFTCEDSDLLLREESHTMAARNQLHDEKQEEEAKAPCLQENEAAELQIPQDTTPRHKEAAAYPSNANSFSLEFELTLIQFLLSLNMFISGDKLQTQQLLFTTICKLQSIALSGEVHKRGTHGDGVPWFIKVHPP